MPRSHPSADPLFSVVIPCFDAAATLEECVGSVFEQTFADFEIILVDDGSNDGSLALVHQLAGRDGRLRLIRQEQAGPSAARNLGVRESRGQLIAFLDADDRWAPEKLACHAEQFARRPWLGVGFAGVVRIDGQGRELGRCRRQTSAGVASLLRGNPTCTTSNVVARRRVFDEVGFFDGEMRHAEDLDWLMRVALDGRWTLEGLARDLTFYRSSPGGLSHDVEAMEAGWFRLALRAAQAAPARVLELLPEGLACQSIYLARQALGSGRRELARAYWRRALRLRPALAFRHPILALKLLGRPSAPFRVGRASLPEPS